MRHLLCCLAMTCLFAQEKPPTHVADFSSAMVFDLASYQPKGPKATPKSPQLICVEKVEFLNFGEERGNWTKYYFHEIADHPEKYQQQLQGALEKVLMLKGFTVVKEGAPKVRARIVFRDFVSPKGNKGSDGSMMYASVKEVAIKADLMIGWIRPQIAGFGQLSMDELGSQIVKNLVVRVEVKPPLAAGFLSLASYPGKSTLEHRPFVEAINTAVETLLRNGLDQYSQRLDQEAAEDIWRVLPR